MVKVLLMLICVISNIYMYLCLTWCYIDILSFFALLLCIAAYWMLCSECCALDAAQCVLCSGCCTEITVHWMQHSVCCAVDDVQWMLCIGCSTVCVVQCAVDSLLFISHHMSLSALLLLVRCYITR